MEAEARNGVGEKPGLRQTMETLHLLLRGAIGSGHAAELMGVPENRLRIYQEFVRDHIASVLQKNYTVLSDLLGAEGRWESVVERFFQRCPAGEYELNANAAQLRELLDLWSQQGELGITRFHVELAELEWQEFAVYTAEAEIPTADEAKGLTLNPTLVVLRFDHAVAEYIEAWREQVPGSPPPPVPDGPAPETLLVFREPVGQLAVFYRATDDLLFVLKMVHEGIGVEQAARLSGLEPEVVSGFVEHAVELGLIVAPAAEQSI
jgi:hypothetical protein